MKIQEVTKKVSEQLQADGIGGINVGQITSVIIAAEECGFIQRIMGSPNSVILPRELTAENGAKYLMSGEFSEQIKTHCPDCHRDGMELDCELCGGEGHYYEKYTVPWTTIKDIYRKIVEHYTK